MTSKLDNLLEDVEQYRQKANVSYNDQQTTFEAAGMAIPHNMLKFAKMEALEVRTLFKSRVQRKVVILLSGWVHGNMMSVRANEDNTFTVFDGNHRLAAIRSIIAEQPTHPIYHKDFAIPCVVFGKNMPDETCLEYGQLINTLQAVASETGTPLDFLHFLRNILLKHQVGATAQTIYTSINKVFQHMGQNMPAKIKISYVENALTFLRAVGDEGLKEAERLMNIDAWGVFNALKARNENLESKWSLDLPGSASFHVGGDKHCFLPDTAWIFRSCGWLGKAYDNVPEGQVPLAYLRAMWASWIFQGAVTMQQKHHNVLTAALTKEFKAWGAVSHAPQEQSIVPPADWVTTNWEQIIPIFKVLKGAEYSVL